MSAQTGIIKVQIPLTYLNEIIASIGIDAHQYHDSFRTVTTRTPYPVVHGGEESVRTRMLVRPNAFADPRTDNARKIFEDNASRVLVPGRIWWDTAHVIALYSTEPVISNVFYTVRPKVTSSAREYAEKAFVLWLNTMWGILTVLLNREETRGRWTRLTMGQWRLLKVLNVTTLDSNVLKKLASIFDVYASSALRRIPEQFDPQNPDPTRLAIDKSFVKVFNSSVSDEVLEEKLRDLYIRIHISLQQWIGK